MVGHKFGNTTQVLQPRGGYDDRKTGQQSVFSATPEGCGRLVPFSVLCMVHGWALDSKHGAEFHRGRVRLKCARLWFLPSQIDAKKRLFRFTQRRSAEKLPVTIQPRQLRLFALATTTLPPLNRRGRQAEPSAASALQSTAIMRPCRDCRNPAGPSTAERLYANAPSRQAE